MVFIILSISPDIQKEMVFLLRSIKQFFSH